VYLKATAVDHSLPKIWPKNGGIPGRDDEMNLQNLLFSGLAKHHGTESFSPVLLKKTVAAVIVGIILNSLLWFLMPAHVDAEISDVKMSDACNILNIIGLPTRRWETPFNNECGCSSRGRPVGTGNPFQNEISYFVEGTGQTVSQIRLIVSILNLDDWATALAEFQFAVKYLVTKLTGRMVPETIKYAIEQGTDAQAQLKGFTIMVKHKEWIMNSDSGRVAGYDVRLVIR